MFALKMAKITNATTRTSLRMQSQCSTGLVPIFFDSSPLPPQQLHPQSKKQVGNSQQIATYRTKICSGDKVRGEGRRLVHTAISMIYWSMGSFLRAAGIPFCSRTSVTMHQINKLEIFCCLYIILSPH